MRIPSSMSAQTYLFLSVCIVMLDHAEENGVRHQSSPCNIYYQPVSRSCTSIIGDFCLFSVATLYISKLDFIEYQHRIYSIYL